MTVTSTLAGDDLVVIVSIGIDIAPTTTVSSVTAPGATFALRAALSNGVARVEIWSARNIPAGITSVTVNFVAATNATVAIFEYRLVAALGTTATASDVTANPSVSLTTQDGNNVVVGGFAASAAGIAAFTALTGTLRQAPVTAAGDVTDVAGALTDNTSVTPASVTNAVTQAAATWAAAALELRSVVVVSQPVTTGTSIIKTVGKPVSQPVTTLTTSRFVLTKAGKTMTVTQPVTIGTSLVKTIVKVVSQRTTVATAVTNRVTKPVSQSITVLSSGVFLRIRFLAVTQPVTLGTSMVKTVVKIVSQPLTTATSVSKTVTKPVSQPITVGTSVIKTVTKPVSQPITISTGVSKVVTKILSQGVTVLTVGSFTIPSVGPKILKVTQPVTVLTVFVASGQNRGYFWGPSPPSSPALAAVWMDTLTNLLKKWNGSGWVVVP